MYQQCTIVGNLGRDPEMRYTTAGKAVTQFTVAVNSRVQEGEEWVDKATWFRVTAWDRLAETANQYLKKGKQVLVTGRVDVSSWKTEGGEARAQLELSARDIKFLGGREEGTPESARPTRAPASDDEDIPF